MFAVGLLGWLALAPALAAAEPPNILLITIDTLRADHLSCYGYPLRTTPNIDRLAGQGVRFERAYTPIPLTGPAHISLFTGRYPQEHGARINGLAHDDKARLLFWPQILRRYGYRNAAFVSAWPLAGRLSRLDELFDHYDEELNRSYQWLNSSRWAEDVTPKAIAWLRTAAHRPFLLWVHYFDPHSPYRYRREFGRLARIGRAKRAAMSEEMRERVARYDSEIAYTDHHVGKLLEALEALDLARSTLVVLLSDHGESLGEHGYVGHGRHLYENIVRIPLILRWPGIIAAGKVVEGAVSLVDVAPTIIELAIERFHGPLNIHALFSGRSFAKALEPGGMPPQERLIRHITFGGKKGFWPRWLSFLWTDLDDRPLRIGLLAGSRKLIYSPQSGSLEIYDLGRDPQELLPTRPARKSPLYQTETARLEQWLESTAGAAGENRMTERDLRVLRSLGYVR